MRWTQAEIARLIQTAEAYENDPCWEEIGETLGRTPSSCRSKYARADKNIRYLPEFPGLKEPDVDIDEWLDQLEVLQSLRKRAQPSTETAVVKIETGGKPIAFSPVSCIHLGGLYTYYPGFRERLRQVLEIERFYIGTHGDDIEAFPPGWAQTVFQNLIPPDIQRAILVKIVEKLAEKGKLLYALWGNHEAFMERIAGENPSSSIYYKNEIPYIDGKGILKLHVGDQLYVGVLAHKLKGISQYNPNHPQGKQFRMFPFADFVISAHLHQYAYQEYHCNATAYDAGLVENRMARLIQVGSTKLDDPYTMRFFQKGVWDFDTWPVMILSSKKHAIHRVHDIESLKWYLDRKDF